MTEKQVTAIVIGAGNRGFGFAEYALKCSDMFKIVGVAEPRKYRREKMRELHDIPSDATFATWQEIAAKERFADAALITTMDQMHKDPAIACARKGYHILLEKPMATTLADCREIVDVCRESGVMLAVGHVLRYDGHATKIRDIIRSGELGQVVNIQHLEPIGYWHFCHSFVRGNWRNVDSSTFLLLSKCCHDLDLIQMWLGTDDKCKMVSSFGSLVHFKKENKPEGSGSRCLDCAVEENCAFSAKRLYCGLIEKGHTGWPVKVLTDGTPDMENVLESLRSGPYGRCAFDCDNDVVDNQVVIMIHESGATVTLTTTAFTKEVCERNVTIRGTKGELTCHFAQPDLHVFDFLSNKKKTYNVFEEGADRQRGHGDADFATIKSFVEAVQKNDERLILTGPEESLQSHVVCFAAERSRVEGRTVKLEEFY